MKENFGDHDSGCIGTWPKNETEVCTGAAFLD